MKKTWMNYLVIMLSVLMLALTGCQSSDDDDDDDDDTTTTSSTTTTGKELPSLHSEAQEILPLAGQASSSSVFVPGAFKFPVNQNEEIHYAAIGSFAYSATADYTSQDFKSFFNGLFDASNDTVTTTVLGLIGHGEFFSNDIYYNYPDGTESFAAQRSARNQRTVRSIAACNSAGAVDIQGETVTIPYFNETVTGMECFHEATSDIPDGHDAMFNVFVKNDQSSDIKFLHTKINDSSNGKQYLVFYGDYSETTHNFNLKIAQLDDKSDGDEVYDTDEWRIAAKISGNVENHTFTIQLSSGDIQMVGKGKSEGTGARFLAGFKKSSTDYFFCIDSSGETKTPVTTTSDCDDYVSDVELMEFLDQITGSFDVTPTHN